MKRKVYIETSVASYLTARPSQDASVAANQKATVAWWTGRRPRFDLYISELVLQEASKGDPDAAARRLIELQGIPLLALNDRAKDLAGVLVATGIVPRKAVEDALHVAIATSHGVDFLLTWNCRHIANAEVTGRMEQCFLELGWRLPVLCTPEQLMGD